ncbi:MAG: hypothetical protein Kow00120_23630 [Anaerolineae bacterium]
MSRKLIVAIGCTVLLLALGVLVASAQEEEGHPIVTTATNVVGVGTYVAAQEYAAPAGEDPEAQPVQAIILPYGIYPDMLVMEIGDFVQPEPLVEGFTFAWSLEAPEGSAAELLADGPVAIFLADVQGDYALTLTATDENGNSGSSTWNVHAGTYVGVGGIVGEPEMPQCAVCHINQAEAWAATGHADMFIRAITGEASDHYTEACIVCHTTGFNDMPTAVNGGFDDLAAMHGWEFPEELTADTWEAMKAEFPEVAALANIQCESCHGPGSEHFNGDPTNMGPIGLGLDYGACAQCHAEQPYHVFPQQWELSGHAQANAQAFTYPIGEDHASCVRCHSGVGFIDWANGIPTAQQRTDYQVITCAVCHDPHDAANPNQLRVFDVVVLPDGTNVTNAGPAATCMSCHNARRDPVATVEGESFGTPHYSTAAELMNSTGGYTWGETLTSGVHGMVVQETCIGCHMAATPGMDDAGAPLPGHNTVGAHTFAMVSADGVENVAACQTCHQGIESFAFEASGDFDGDGTVETGPEEVAGLRETLEAAIVEAGVEVLDHHPYFTLPDGAGVDLKGAVYNLKFTESGGSVAHNMKYTVALLQLSIEKLTGAPVPGADTP